MKWDDRLNPSTKLPHVATEQIAIPPIISETKTGDGNRYKRVSLDVFQ